MTDLEKALGQYLLYHALLTELEPHRLLYLAVPRFVYRDVFEERIGKAVLRAYPLRLITFEPQKEVLLQWIPEPITDKSSNAC